MATQSCIHLQCINTEASNQNTRDIFTHYILQNQMENKIEVCRKEASLKEHQQRGRENSHRFLIKLHRNLETMTANVLLSQLKFHCQKKITQIILGSKTSNKKHLYSQVNQIMWYVLSIQAVYTSLSSKTHGDCKYPENPFQ